MDAVLQLVRTHKGMDNRSFKCIHLKEDAEGKQGLSVSKDVIEIGGHALKANITTLGPLVLPVSEQLHFFTDLIFKGGDRVWQIAFGSGFKCSSVVWKALKNVGRPKRSPWFELEDSQ